MALRPPDTTASIPLGATISTSYAGREVRVYAVLEQEVDILSRLNTQTTIYFSLAVALASLAAGVWVTAGFSEKLTAEGAVMSHFAAPALCALAGVFLGMALMAWRSRKSTWDAIRLESRSHKST